MERECEVKLLGIDRKQLEDQLVKKGAEFLGEEHQENRLYTSPSFEKLAPQGSYLRVRIVKTPEGDLARQELTYKENISHEQWRENREYHVEIDDVKNLEIIFRVLGVSFFETGFKKRRSYRWNNMRFDFDEWDEASFPFPYVEVEMKDLAQLEVIKKEFGIQEEQISRKSIHELKQSFENEA